MAAVQVSVCTCELSRAVSGIHESDKVEMMRELIADRSFDWGKSFLFFSFDESCNRKT